MKKGFTLLELLIVVGILSLLVTLSSTIFNYAQKKSRDSKRIADLEQIRVALESYRTDNAGTYPANTTLLQTGGYLPSVPTDPKASYRYMYQLPGNDYDLQAFLELGGTCGTTALNCSTTSTAQPCNYCLGPYGKK